jgi:hypothetical protein
MDKTPFSNKVEILGDFYAEVCESESIMSSQLMEDHRDIFFLCLSSNVKWVTLEERVHWFVEDTWKAFCDYVGIDHHGEYENFVMLMRFAESMDE